jgi:hypothetical protein
MNKGNQGNVIITQSNGSALIKAFAHIYIYIYIFIDETKYRNTTVFDFLAVYGLLIFLN